MKVFTAAGAIHIEDDEPFECTFVADLYGDVRMPTDTAVLIPVYHDGDIVRDARTGEILARRIGVITGLKPEG